MKIAIESTEVLTTYNGAPARLWKGVTEGGVVVHVFVTGIAVPLDADQGAFERELRETAAPIELQAISLRKIL